MSPTLHSSGLYRFGLCAASVVLSVLVASGAARAAEPRTGAWELDSYIDLSGATNYLVQGGKATTLPTVGAEIGARFTSLERPLAAGLFASYKLEPRSAGETLRVTGSWVSYRYLRWEFSTAVAYVASNSSSAFWMQASELKFRPRPGHKLSVEALAAIGGGRPAFHFSYSVDLPRNLSLTLGAGVGSNRLFDFAGNAKVVWSLH
jgi:hypothetical protein